MFITAVLMTLTPVELVQNHTSPSAQLFVGPSLLASVILLAFALLFSFKLETQRPKYLISDGVGVNLYCFCVKCLENYWTDCRHLVQIFEVPKRCVKITLMFP